MSLLSKAPSLTRTYPTHQQSAISSGKLGILTSCDRTLSGIATSEGVIAVPRAGGCGVAPADLQIKVGPVVAAQVADMLEAAVARSQPGEGRGQQAERSSLLPRSLQFPRDPVSAAKKVDCLTIPTPYPAAPPSTKGIRMRNFHCVQGFLQLLTCSNVRCPASFQYRRSRLRGSQCCSLCSALKVPQPAPVHATG